MTTAISSAEIAGLRVVVYPGDQKILLAMSLTDVSLNETDKNFAGFAIWRNVGGKGEKVPSNRISFDIGVSSATTAETRKWTPSDQAPFQKFRWVDVPPEGLSSPITYRVQARYFVSHSKTLKDGPQVSITVAPAIPQHKNFRPAFTRGYIASQAYADKFDNKDIRPTGPKTPTFDTKPFEAQYQWLNDDARALLFDFIKDCENSTTAHVDVFAYAGCHRGHLPNR